MYAQPDCRSDRSFIFWETANNVADVAYWHNTAASFKCARAYKKREIQSVESTPAAVAAPELSSQEVAALKAAGPEDAGQVQVAEQNAAWGACVDHCTGADFTGTFTRNDCTNYGECISLAGGLNSIGFAGAMYCWLYIHKNCMEEAHWLGTNMIASTTQDIGATAGWSPDIALSFRCQRTQ